jgi:hypothetical protein
VLKAHPGFSLLLIVMCERKEKNQRIVKKIYQNLKILKILSLSIFFKYFFFFFFFFYYSYVHTRLGSFLPPAPSPSLTTHSALSLSPPTPQYPAETILPLFLILL